MKQMEHNLVEQAAQWICEKNFLRGNNDEMISSKSLEEQSSIKRPRLPIGIRQSLIAHIARLESLKDSVRRRFMQVSAGYSAELRWREIPRKPYID